MGEVCRKRLRLPVTGQPVDAVDAIVHRPTAGEPRGAVFLTHGAGGDLDTPGLSALCDVLAGLGRVAVRANLPFRQAGRRATPRAEAAVPGYVQLVERARAAVGGGLPWVAGGKSYGGRVASLAAADGSLEVVGLLFYGYPLHPPGKPERLRVEHWPQVRVPCLFLQGTRDAFCELPLLRRHLGSLGAGATLEVVEGGDHSLDVTKAASPDGVSRRDGAVFRTMASALAAWLDTTGRAEPR